MIISFKSWIFLIILSPLQIYLIYRSIYKYLLIKTEVFEGHLIHDAKFKWLPVVQYLQLFSIIGSLGLLPLWLCYSIFASSSFFNCNAANSNIQLKFDSNGFHCLITKEVYRILQLCYDYSDINAGQNLYVNKIKCVLFVPVSEILHVLMAAFMAIPIPFISSWIIETNNENKARIWSSNFDFIWDNAELEILMKWWTVEYVNLFIALLHLSIQYPRLFWKYNRQFSMILSVLHLLIFTNILVDYSVICVFIKTYYSRYSKPLKNPYLLPYIFKHPYFIVTVAVCGNICLSLISLTNFLFGFDKLVKSLTRYSVIFNSNLPNMNMNNTSSNVVTTSSVLTNGSERSFSFNNTNITNNSIRIKSNFMPHLCGFLLFVVDAALKFVRYYFAHGINLENSKIFSIYIGHSLVWFMVYIMFWLGCCVKRKWSFKVPQSSTEILTTSLFTNSTNIELTPSDHRSNSYKSIKNMSYTNQNPQQYLGNKSTSPGSNQNNIFSNHSSNPNLQTSGPTTPTSSVIDHAVRTSSDRSLSFNSSIKSNPYSFNSVDRNSLSSYSRLNQSRMYKTLYACSSPRPNTSEPVNAATPSTFSHYKSTGYHVPIDNLNKYDYAYNQRQAISKINTTTIHEENTNERLNSNDIDDESLVTDEANSSQLNTPKHDTNNSSSSTKFVTFQLDKPSPIDHYPINTNQSDHSSENLTLVSMEPSETFLRELDEIKLSNGTANNNNNNNNNNNSAGITNKSQQSSLIEFYPMPILNNINEGSQV